MANCRSLRSVLNTDCAHERSPLVAFEAVQSHTIRDLHPLSAISFEQDLMCKVNSDGTATLAQSLEQVRPDGQLQTGGG
jgi:hypothetical protein